MIPTMRSIATPSARFPRALPSPSAFCATKRNTSPCAPGTAARPATPCSRPGNIFLKARFSCLKSPCCSGTISSFTGPAATRAMARPTISWAAWGPATRVSPAAIRSPCTTRPIRRRNFCAAPWCIKFFQTVSSGMKRPVIRDGAARSKLPTPKRFSTKSGTKRRFWIRTPSPGTTGRWTSSEAPCGASPKSWTSCRSWA